MNGIGQVLATGGTTIAGVALGAGLTYWLGALTRRQQEAREDRTRWYEARLRAYEELCRATREATLLNPMTETGTENYMRTFRDLSSVVGQVQLVGSKEVIESANELVRMVIVEIQRGVKERESVDSDRVGTGVTTFVEAARRDLGH
jgi:hypothetical protein